MKLSALTIESMPFSDRQKTIFDDQLPGFGLRVGKKAKTFILMIGRERKLHSLGRFPAVGLKQARTAALRLLADKDATKHVKPRVKSQEAIEAFMVEKQAQSRAETLKIYNRTLRNHLKGIHQKYIEDVTTDDITRVTDRLLKAEKGASANQTLVQAKTFFAWCVKRRLIPHSPAEGLDKPARQANRERILTDDELRKLWKATEKDTPFHAIIRLCILCGQRRGELSQVQPEWIEENTLTIPATSTKNKNKHGIPLGALSTMLLKRCPFSFNDWHRGKERLDKASGVTNWVIHDLRRTYCTNLQRLGVRLEVIESLVNHISGSRSGVAGIYQRHRWETEMREAVRTFEKWFTRTILPHEEP